MSARRVEAAGRPAQLAGGASREYPHDGLGVLSDHRGDLRVGIAGSPTLAHLRQDDLLVFVGNEPLLDNVVSERPLAAAVDALIGQMALHVPNALALPVTSPPRSSTCSSTCRSFAASPRSSRSDRPSR